MGPVAASFETMNSMVIVVIVLAVILVIGGIIYGIRREKKRSELLGGWASARGWHFMAKSEGSDSTFDNRFPQFGCLSEGSDRYAFNVARGRESEDRRCWAFDYHYETYSTDSKGNRQTHHHYFSAVIMEAGMDLIPLTIRKEGWWDKVTSAFGFDDIDFESAEFSRAFHVSSQDRKWAYDVLNQDNMEYLLESPKHSLVLAGPHMIAYKKKRFSPEEFDLAIGLINGVLRRIPKDIREARAL